MIVFLHGKDLFRVVRRRTAMREAFWKKYPEGTIVTLDAEECGNGIVSAIVSAGAGDLFASVRLVDIRGACVLPEEVQEELIGYLRRIGDDFPVLFSEASAFAVTKSPLAAYLKKHAGKTEVIDTFKPGEAERFLEDELDRWSPDVAWSREVKRSVLSAVGTDSARLSSIVETLVAYGRDAEISVEDVAFFVRPDPTERVFDALDALIAGDRGRAASMLLRESRTDAGGVHKLFGLLAWQIRELFKVRGEYDRGVMRADDIARATGMKPFVAGKFLAKMGVFPLSRLRSGLALLADLDADMKTGRIEPELALTLFVEKL